MDLRDKTVLILGGAGLVGIAVARKILDSGPRRIVIGSLRKAETDAALEELSADPRTEGVDLAGVWGDLFVPHVMKDMARSEVLDDVEDSMMFDGRAHRGATEPRDRSGDRRVVALGSTAGEHDLVRTAPDDRRHGVTGLVDGLAGPSREAVRARRVGVRVGEVGHHRLDRLRPHRRGRGVVEIGDRRLGHPSHATAARSPDGPDVTSGVRPQM